MAKKKTLFEELSEQVDTKPIQFDDQPGCQAQNDLPATYRAVSDYAKDLPDTSSVKAGLTRDFEPTTYVAGEANQQSCPGIPYPGPSELQTHTRWYYGFRIARALIISGTIIYTIHRGLFELIAWFVKR